MQIRVVVRDFCGKYFALAEGNLKCIEEIRAKARAKLVSVPPPGRVYERIYHTKNGINGEEIKICKGCTQWKLLGNNTICTDCDKKFKDEIRSLPRNGM